MNLQTNMIPKRLSYSTYSGLLFEPMNQLTGTLIIRKYIRVSVGRYLKKLIIVNEKMSKVYMFIIVTAKCIEVFKTI